MKFIDSNVFIYAADSKNPVKRSIASSLLGDREAWSFGVFFEVFSQSPKLRTSQQRKQGGQLSQEMKRAKLPNENEPNCRTARD